MAYTTINKSTEHFNTKIYTGNGGTNAQTGVGFQPDLTWIKNRTASGEGHHLYDVVRGVTKRIRSDTNAAESTVSTGLTTFGTDGFTVGNTAGVNGNGNGIVAWNWKAGGTASSNTDGSITSSVSVNATAGMSIVKWSGTSATGTVGHGLNSVPKTVWVKSLGNAEGIYTYWQPLGNTKQLLMSSTSAQGTTTLWNNTTPTSSVFSVTNHSAVNGSGDYIAYCFAEKQGYSKFGSYIGNGNANGAFIYTGQKSAFIMIKRTNAAGHWQLVDTKRPSYNPQYYLRANSNNVEATDIPFDIVSNGFKTRSTDTSYNGSGDSYIYMAFGQSIVGSNNVPNNAR